MPLDSDNHVLLEDEPAWPTFLAELREFVGTPAADALGGERIVELAIDKQAQTILMPVAARRQLNDLPDDLWTKISIEFYRDSADAVFKALVE